MTRRSPNQPYNLASERSHHLSLFHLRWGNVGFHVVDDLFVNHISESGFDDLTEESDDSSSQPLITAQIENLVEK